MSIRIGDLDRQIRIEQKVAGSPPVTAEGEENYAWGTYADGVWAARRDLRGEEFLAQFGKQAEVTTAYKIRWLEGITLQMRFVDLESGDVYDIQHIARLGRKDALELWGKATAGATAP